MMRPVERADAGGLCEAVTLEHGNAEHHKEKLRLSSASGAEPQIKALRFGPSFLRIAGKINFSAQRQPYRAIRASPFCRASHADFALTNILFAAPRRGR